MNVNGEMRLVKTVLRSIDSPVVFDVGANKGEWTTELLRVGSADLKVYLFEPFPTTFATLSGNISDPRATLCRIALSDSVDDAITGYEASPTAGSNSLQRDVNASSITTVELSCTTIDAFMDEGHLDHVDYVKSDTEGHDMAVIRGALQALTAGSIGVLQFEYNHRWVFARHFLLDIFKLIEDKPYALAKICPKSIEIHERWHPELERFFEANYALVRADLLDALPTLRGRFDGSNTYA